MMILKVSMLYAYALFIDDEYGCLIPGCQSVFNDRKHDSGYTLHYEPHIYGHKLPTANPEGITYL
jgi:hypothetical protein